MNAEKLAGEILDEMEHNLPRGITRDQLIDVIRKHVNQHLPKGFVQVLGVHAEPLPGEWFMADHVEPLSKSIRKQFEKIDRLLGAIHAVGVAPEPALPVASRVDTQNSGDDNAQFRHRTVLGYGPDPIKLDGES